MASASGSPLLQSLQASGGQGLAALLAEDVVFHSPVRTYRGRAPVAHLLTIIAEVVEGLAPTRELRAGRETVTLVAGRVGKHAVDGALVESLDASGAVAEVTLMLRPLDGLLAGVERMGQLLGGRPLPG
jgi:hypothetical protein